MSSQQEQKTIEAKTGEHCYMHHEESMPSAPLSALDRYTALRNHRIRFQDALDPNAERVTTLRKHDIIFGRGKNMQDYPGNRRMRSIINKYKQHYHSIQRSEKRDLIESVYKELVQGGARFLTKASNKNHFVVVDIEAALQKVGNTLRCRKNWNKKLETSANMNGQTADTPLETKKESPNSKRKAHQVTTAPHLKNSSQMITRLPQISPLILRRRLQTMSLFRENTIRLMQQQPLRPVTVGDVFCLHNKSSPWYPYQLGLRNSFLLIDAASKNGLSSRTMRNALYAGGTAVPSTVETAAVRESVDRKKNSC